MSDALRIRSGEFGRVALLDMDRSLVRHAHPHCHVLLKVGGADTSFLVGDRVARLTDETAVLVNSWTPHAYVHRPAAPRSLILALYIEPGWLANFRPNWGPLAAADFFATPEGGITRAIRRLAAELAGAMVAAPSAVADHEEILARLMIAVIERFSEWRSVGDGLRAAARRNAVDGRVRRAIRLVSEAPCAVATVDSLAEIAGMSRANFFRVFEVSTGVTPRVFMNAMRLEFAVAATTTSDVSFGELGVRAGFSTQAHFTRFFRDHAGVPPSQYRRVARLGGLADELAI